MLLIDTVKHWTIEVRGVQYWASYALVQRNPAQEGFMLNIVGPDGLARMRDVVARDVERELNFRLMRGVREEREQRGAGPVWWLSELHRLAQCIAKAAEADLPAAAKDWPSIPKAWLHDPALPGLDKERDGWMPAEDWKEWPAVYGGVGVWTGQYGHVAVITGAVRGAQ